MNTLRAFFFSSLIILTATAVFADTVIEQLASFDMVSGQKGAVEVVFDKYIPDNNGATNGVTLNSTGSFYGFYNGLNGQPGVGLLVEGSKGKVVFADYYTPLVTSDIIGGDFQDSTYPDSGATVIFIFVDPSDSAVNKTFSRVAFAVGSVGETDNVHASFIGLDGTVFYTTDFLTDGQYAYVAKDSSTGNEISAIHKLVLTSNGVPPQLWSVGYSGDTVTTDFAFANPPSVILSESDDTKVVEGGAVDSYTLVLGCGAPTSDVAITIEDSSDSPQVQFLIDGVAGNVTTFTAENWSQPKTITVQAIDDPDSEATHYAFITHHCVSSDADYNNAEISDIDVKITDNDGNCIKVFLIGGQSNAAGSGLNEDYPELYQSPQYDVEFWRGGRFAGDGVPDYQFDREAYTEFGPLELGSGNYLPGTHSGFEMSLGRTLKDALPDDNIAIIKYGMSGSALYRGLRPDGAGDWDSDPAPLGSSFDGVRYHVFKNSAVDPALQVVLDRGDYYKIEAMFWMQGETDSRFSYAANAYEANLQKLINKVRTEFNAGDMKFIIGRVRTVMGDYNSIVRAAQQNVAAADPLAEWINTDDFTVNSDNIHYDSLGLVAMGERFADSYLGTLSMQGDFEADGDIDLADFSLLAQQWLANCECCLQADLNNDLKVDVDDLLVMSGNWLW